MRDRQGAPHELQHTFEFGPRGDGATGHLSPTDKQTIALEKIADGVQSMRDDLRGILGALQRIATRGGHNED